MNLCEIVAFIALKDTKGPEIWLEANTERSESNLGRSLGIIKHEGTAVWKTVPPNERSIRVNPINPCSKKLSGEMNTDYKN